MAAQNRVLLTEQQIDAWKAEDERLTVEIAERQERQSVIKRKLQAAEEFLGADADLFGAANETAGVEAEKAPDEPSESPAVLLVENMRNTAASLNAAQVKARLIELGFAGRLQKQPNYHYSLLHRLHASDKLLKRGSKYRAAPISSPEGETEAVGASVRH